MEKLNLTLNNTDASIMESNEEGKIFKIVFYIFLFIFGTIGNLLVMVVIKSRKKRSVNDFFIFNLAISDLTFVLVSLPFYTYELFLRFDKFGFYCKVVWPMMSVTLCVSIFTLTFMSVERCRAIVFPLKPRIKRTSVLIGLSTVWVASLVCILPLSIVTSAEGELCMERWPSEGHRKAYTIALFAIQYAIPLLIIAMAYITIAIKLVRTEVPDRTSVNNRGQIVKRQSRKENFHIIRTVAVIVSLFLVCMLPNQIAWLLYDFEGEEQAKLFWSFAEALIFLHSCVNPVIYGSLTRQFREGYIRSLHYVCCCGKPLKRAPDFSDFRETRDVTNQHHERSNQSSLKQSNVLTRLKRTSQHLRDSRLNQRDATATSPIATPPTPRGVNKVYKSSKVNKSSGNLVRLHIAGTASKVPERAREEQASPTIEHSNRWIKPWTDSIADECPHYEVAEIRAKNGKYASIIGSNGKSAKHHSNGNAITNNSKECKGKVKVSYSEPNLQSSWRSASQKKSSTDYASRDDLRRSLKRRRKRSARNNSADGCLNSSFMNYGVIIDEDGHYHSDPVNIADIGIVFQISRV